MAVDWTDDVPHAQAEEGHAIGALVQMGQLLRLVQQHREEAERISWERWEWEHAEAIEGRLAALRKLHRVTR